MKSEFERIGEAYLTMAERGNYRPAAPGDGLGGITLSQSELNDPAQLAEEAGAYARNFIAEEDSLKFSIGVSNYCTNRALVYLIEAARLLCAGSADRRAAKLARMALAEICAQSKDASPAEWTFSEWLEHNIWRADPIGDLARDVACDVAWPTPSTYEPCRKYLRRKGACDGALRALHAAWEEYELYLGGPSQLRPDTWVSGVVGG